MIGKWLRYGVLALTVSATSLTGVVPTALARQPAPSGAVSITTLGAIALAELPPEAQSTLKLVQAGGPFPYSKDGTVFGNFERRLSAQPRGYYHEYTVKTPRARNRGARRIICGGPPRYTGDCYYTGDHYASFKRIVG
jgi:ribonuclease T1